MRLLFKYVALIIIALFSLTSAATPTPATALEVNHLLKFIATTDCQYERNSDKHTGKEAAEHIKKKYDYFKDKIVSAEDFIELGATKSAVTGSKYRVHCPGVAVQDSDQWLLAELKKVRK
ncbi:DUF5329 family protein [Methyloglobulus sp.]|uniref:DUF5329 family protein n=1 Tax=Methyloglobulus sp. TaxID=2518622 RepID=UPI0032B84BD6